MDRIILEDTYESFIMCLNAVVNGQALNGGHVIRLSKNDGVNYKRLMDVSLLFGDLCKQLTVKPYESYYIFLEKQYDDLKGACLVNGYKSETFLKRKLVDTVLSSRIKSMSLSFGQEEFVKYKRFTSSHRLLTESDALFGEELNSVKVNIVSNDELQEIYTEIVRRLTYKSSLPENPLLTRFTKLAYEYKEEYLMSKVGFAEVVPVEDLDLKNKILEQQESFIKALFNSSDKNAKYIYKQGFNADAKIWMIDQLESLGNI